MTVTVPESLAEKLGMDAYDITYLLGCINDESSESTLKQLRDLILTLKLEHGDKLADKKSELDRAQELHKAQLELVRQEMSDVGKQLCDAEQKWQEQCWGLIRRLNDGEKIKFDRNDEAHIALLHANIIKCRAFSNNLKLTKPLPQINLAGVRDSEEIKQLRYKKKRVLNMGDFVFGLQQHGVSLF
jgi:hypothetical protein